MKPRSLHVVGELGRQLAVGEPAVALLGHAPPRAEVHLVDRHRARRARCGRARSAIHCRVAPVVVDRSQTTEPVLRRRLGAKRERVGLVDRGSRSAALRCAYL